MNQIIAAFAADDQVAQHVVNVAAVVDGAAVVVDNELVYFGIAREGDHGARGDVAEDEREAPTDVDRKSVV